ncbi:hypothetical protein ACGF1Z_13435 [Streptomyces sp. NPDC048018]
MTTDAGASRHREKALTVTTRGQGHRHHPDQGRRRAPAGARLTRDPRT